MDTLLTVIVKAREKLRLSIVLMTDGTSDFFLQLFPLILFANYVCCHDEKLDLTHSLQYDADSHVIDISNVYSCSIVY